MDAIFEKILEIEHSAENIVREAEQKNFDSEAIILAEKETLQKQITEESAGKIAAVRQNMLAKAEKEAKLHEEGAAEKIAQMEARAAEHTEEWVQELYRRITEGDPNDGFGGNL